MLKGEKEKEKKNLMISIPKGSELFYNIFRQCNEVIWCLAHAVTNNKKKVSITHIVTAICGDFP